MSLSRSNSFTDADAKKADLLIIEDAQPPARGVLTQEEQQFMDSFPQEARDKAFRKVDIRLIPMLALLYLFSFIDRANLGNAKIEGLIEDLNLTGVQYNVVSSIFFATYCLFQVPSNTILQSYFPTRPSLWIAILTLSWGIIMTCHGVVQSYSGLIVVRVLMGIPEAGFFPGAVLICSKWYPRSIMASRVSLFYTASALAGAVSGLLAFGIAKMAGVGGYNGWRWIFILEGLMTVVLGVLCPFVLIDSPSRSKWLTEDERRFLTLIMAEQDGGTAGKARSSKVSWKTFWSVITSWQIYLQILVYWSNTVPNYALKFTMPTIIKQMGFKSSTAQLLTIPAYVVGAISAYLTGRYSDKFKRRFPFIALPQFLVVVAFSIMAPLAPVIKNNIGPCYFAICLACIGFYPINPGGTTWLSNNLAGPAKRAVGLGYLTTFGNLGGMIGGFIYIDKEAPRYPTGYGSSIAFAGAGLVASTILELVFMRINKKRDQVDEEEVREKHTDEQLLDMGDRSPLFRYML
ncbi:hypothetical protein I302_107914 [Kwoniella bestiolae CBS 10118]|uniref:Major facilitator superfamily (MFS) profile domain-containing protein n=1 Tax=Kwoniella bestiolae CBS 10118 TaxID=1296100 RepID=A0A1B9FX69_9TREE|nr:hypothetical protein I302_06346 [Kwoniella bestiolae CBS 10118]OCF23365.1 hypothetical protein I302_06346 [Kwoniella bestiolae CBS 10118]